MNIVPIQDVAFDDEATLVMGAVFDQACKSLRDFGRAIDVRNLIAKRIIKAAKNGERDPAQLYRKASSSKVAAPPLPWVKEPNAENVRRMRPTAVQPCPMNCTVVPFSTIWASSSASQFVRRMQRCRSGFLATRRTLRVPLGAGFSSLPMVAG